MDEFPENFRRGRGGHFRSKKFHCNFFCIRNGNFGHEFPKKKLRKKRGGVISDLKNFIANLVPVQPVCGKNRNEIFRKRGGGGQRPFVNFPEIHPFSGRQASLTKDINISGRNLKIIRKKSEAEFWYMLTVRLFNDPEREWVLECRNCCQDPYNLAENHLLHLLPQCLGEFTNIQMKVPNSKECNAPQGVRLSPEGNYLIGGGTCQYVLPKLRVGPGWCWHF